MRFAILLFWSLTALSDVMHGQSDWPAYGGDLGNTRYSALDQINIQNITKLTQAWAYDMRTAGARKANRPGASHATGGERRHVYGDGLSKPGRVAAGDREDNLGVYAQTRGTASARDRLLAGRQRRILRKSCLEPGMVSCSRWTLKQGKLFLVLESKAKSI